MEQNKIIRSGILFFCSIFFYAVVIAQDMPKELRTREILLTYTDSLLKFNILTKALQKETKTSLLYYWFGSEMLHINRGGCAGNLLDGKYLVFDKKMRLRVEGFFKEGLKSGIWKSWYESGELMSVVKWENGQKEGKAFFYDNFGNLQKVCNYKDDLLDGTTVVYRGKSIEKIKYKDGIEKKPAPKKTRQIKRTENLKGYNKISISRNDTTHRSTSFFHRLFKRTSGPDNKKNKVNRPDNKNIVGANNIK
ncbi:MAG TPA: hypothetical protein VIH57_02310, partial [Bacteroidales bacterium]